MPLASPPGLPPVTPGDLTAFLHRRIPLARLMGLQVTGWDGKELRVSAPLQRNSNHEGTGFGGSIATLALVAGWAFVHARLSQQGFEPARLVVQRSETIYTRPITGDMEAVCRDDGKTTWQKFLRSVMQRRRGRIHLRMEVYTMPPEGSVESALSPAAVQDSVYVVADAPGKP